jgi:hypothetical protein
MVSIPLTELSNSSYDQSKAGTLFSPTPMFKSLPNKRLQHIQRRQQQQQQNNKNDTEQTNNMCPPIITMPHLMEFSRRLSYSSSLNDNDGTITDTQIDSNSIHSPSKQETPILRTKMPILNNKRTFSQKIPNYVLQSPLSTIESVLKERSIGLTQENSPNQSNRLRCVNQIFKKQIFLPFEKK